MATRGKLQPGTIAMAVVGVIAALLYAWFLSAYFTSAIGDAVVGQALEALTALLLLWLALLGLMLFDRGLGGPSWPRRAGFLLVPMAGIATTFATDYPHDRLCRLTVVGMPLLIGAYMAAGRLPTRRAAWAQAALLLPMLALSAYAIELFLS